MSIIHSVLDIVIEHADKYSAKRVIKINLEVGELSDIIPHWMQEYFDMLSKDTIAERAELCIEKIPAILKYALYITCTRNLIRMRLSL